MSEQTAPAAAPSRGHGEPSQGWPTAAFAMALIALAFAAYSRTFSVPFLLDDDSSVTDNSSIRHLATAFSPPAGTTVSGRPVLNLSLAANYAVSGTDVWSYHVLNLVIHVLAALALLGIVRRTLAARGSSSALGCAVALLWMLHPLVTESVTYVIQRAESLMGLFYLLTLYCFIRGAATGTGKGLWYAASIAACFLGMGTKEVMATAPLVVLLYDRTFIAGSFAQALLRRRWVYLGMAASWLLLAFLVISTHGRNGTAGLGGSVSSWDYAMIQLPAIVHYLRLCYWPHPLIFDYGAAASYTSGRVALGAAAIAVLAAATIWALVRRPALGFLGACFFVILAPSSSVVPVTTEALAEHRMYLPLIPVVVITVLGMARWLGRASAPVFAALAGLLCLVTFERNLAYGSEERIWADTVASRPGNARAQDNLGFIIAKTPGRVDEAIPRFEEALRLKPDFVEAHYNLAYALLGVPGRLNDSISHYEAALRLNPRLVKVHFNLGRALATIPGRSSEAAAQYEEAIVLKPDYAEARYNLGCLLETMPGRAQEAAQQFEAAVRLMPENAAAHFSLGSVLQAMPGRLDDAVAHYREAIRLKPDYAQAHLNLGSALGAMPGHLDEAVAQYEEAIRLAPGYAEAHYDLGCALQAIPGRLNEAMAQYDEVIRLKPDDTEARCNLGNALNSLGRTPEAISEYQEAVRLKPGDPAIRINFAIILLKEPGRSADAVAQLSEALRLQPGNETARRILARVSMGGP